MLENFESKPKRTATKTADFARMKQDKEITNKQEISALCCEVSPNACAACHCPREMKELWKPSEVHFAKLNIKSGGQKHVVDLSMHNAAAKRKREMQELRRF